ncbi:MAG: GNAT family N-acetyltransferase [Anaerolineales bacterium]|nr:GNAT family N-acetyltransferase [Anaerolineales bacterium]MCX7753894.1 GNAT family N-acetyltransferase [Anaerolineales bacterium]MDW8276848.1 GNAT family N-acetyltransferase [Anaerolineales bacterium]
MTEIILREFRFPHDYEAVFALWQNAGEGLGIGLSDTPEEIEKKTRFAPDLFLVAESDGRILGTVIGGFDGRRGLIYHLAVDAEFRGRGIGTRLMDEIEARLKAKGCRRAYLLVKRGNSAAEMYEKRGWSEMTSVRLFGKNFG